MNKVPFLILVILCLILFSQPTAEPRTSGTNPVKQPTPSQLGKEPQPQPQAPKIADGPYTPNEAGEVLILMYHQIGTPEGEWIRTPEHFKNDLERLFNNGYRPVPLNDYLAGHINLPRGYAPVILTFDDASPGQFRLIDGQVDPQSAVGIITSFSQEHPGFKPHATFFSYYGSPFGQRETVKEKYELLISFGMEIGNHTDKHRDLSKLSNEEVEASLRGHWQETGKLLPNYKPQALALPYGKPPKNRALALEGNGYRHKGVLLVGSRPAFSPQSKEFDPLNIPRVRAAEPYLSQWLKYFDEHPEKRYVSAGK